MQGFKPIVFTRTTSNGDLCRALTCNQMHTKWIGCKQYCCTGPTNYSRFFKDRCPDAYSYPKDDPSSTFTCPSGTNYRVIFCP
ncbi:hypothetical protein AMTRI_Chr02g212760 [Amborella trichopoda]